MNSHYGVMLTFEEFHRLVIDHQKYFKLCAKTKNHIEYIELFKYKNIDYLYCDVCDDIKTLILEYCFTEDTWYDGYIDYNLYWGIAVANQEFQKTMFMAFLGEKIYIGVPIVEKSTNFLDKKINVVYQLKFNFFCKKTIPYVKPKLYPSLKYIFSI